jgi:hypothetical protein
MTDPNQFRYDHERWLLEMRREDATRAHDAESTFFREVNKSAIDGANLTLRTALLINGGACIAVLGFLGALLSKQQ